MPEPLPNKPEEHYQIGKAQNHPVDVSIFAQQHSNDPATKVLALSPLFRKSFNVNLGLHIQTQASSSTSHCGHPHARLGIK
jgi:hypothetical protein